MVGTMHLRYNGDKWKQNDADIDFLWLDYNILLEGKNVTKANGKFYVKDTLYTNKLNQKQS